MRLILIRRFRRILHKIRCGRRCQSLECSLDKSRQGKAQRDMANPSFQIDNYLRATPPKWAILTNGRLWRLYHEDTSVKMDCYYEVNLPELIGMVERTGDLTPFKYYYLFFRREAFPQVPLGPSFLDRIREESLAYAQKIGRICRRTSTKP